MGTAFKLSGDEAANLVEILAKVGGLSADAQEDILHMAAAFGKVNDLRPDILIRAMAQHAGVFARFGEDGAQAFLRSVGAAERLGIELSSIESAADTFLDIDTFFQDVSKLRTLGMDISDPFGLAQIAEFGTPAELIEELQRQLQGIDLTQLSRTRRNALSSALGMDQAELSRLIKGEIGGIKGVSEAQIEELGGFNEGMGGAVDALGAMVGTLGGIAGTLTLLVQLMIVRAGLKGAGSLLGKLLGGGARAAGAAAGAGGTFSLFSGAATTATAVGSGIGASAIAGGAAMAATAIAIAPLVLGAAAIAGGIILNERRKIRRDEASAAAADVRLLRDQTRNQWIVAGQAQLKANPGITKRDLRDALLGLGFNIDGRQAGKLIANAQGPANN